MAEQNSTTDPKPRDLVERLIEQRDALSIEAAEVITGLREGRQELCNMLDRLRRIERAARAYYRGYCQDEAHDRMSCVHDQHHRDAQELRHALGESL